MKRKDEKMKSSVCKEVEEEKQEGKKEEEMFARSTEEKKRTKGEKSINETK